VYDPVSALRTPIVLGPFLLRRMSAFWRDGETIDEKILEVTKSAPAR
jgi:hypothetical protein